MTRQNSPARPMRRASRSGFSLATDLLPGGGLLDGDGNGGDDGNDGGGGTSRFGCGAPRVVAAVRHVEAVLQDPQGDVPSALEALTPITDPLDPNVRDLVDRLLYHGCEEALRAWLPRVASLARHEESPLLQTLRMLGLTDEDGAPLGEGYPLREAQASLLLDEAALRPELRGARLDAAAEWSRIDRVELEQRLKARGGLPAEARQRASHRLDNDGADLVRVADAMAFRFGALLVEHWGWSPGRAHLARLEIARMLYARIEGDPAAPLHGCRECAKEVLPRPDATRRGYATLVALDANAVILAWPFLLMAVGGPFRGAALLEALPLWLRFLESERLLDRRNVTVQAGMLARSVPLLAPGILDETSDRALCAAIRRMTRDGQAAA